MDDDFDISGDFELPELNDILGDFEQPGLEDILYSDEADDLSEQVESIGEEFVSDELTELASNIEDTAERYSEIADLIQQALDDNMHPSELQSNIDGLAPDDVIQDFIDNYSDELSDKLGLEARDDDALSRGIFETYDDLINYLDTFHGGFPDDDIFYIELTDEGYELYVYQDTP